MAYKTPETKVKDSIINWLKPFDQDHSGILYWCRRNAAGPNYRRGLPDLFVVVGRTHIEVEFKSPTGDRSADQERWGRVFAKMGTPYIVVSSLQEFIDYISQYMPENTK